MNIPTNLPPDISLFHKDDDFAPVNGEVLEQRLQARAWLKEVDGFELFQHFRNQSILMLESRGGVYLYDSQNYQQLFNSFHSCLKLIEEKGLPLSLSTMHFRRLIFNCTSQGFILPHALLASENLSEALISLCEHIGFFIHPVAQVPAVTQAQSFWEHFSITNSSQPFIISGQGKSTYFRQALLKGFIVDQRNYCAPALVQMCEEYLLSSKQIMQLLHPDKPCFKKLQEKQPLLAQACLHRHLQNALALREKKPSYSKL